MFNVNDKCMNSFLLKIGDLYIEICFISDDTSVSGDTYYTGEAFLQNDLNSESDKSSMLFSFAFARDSDNWRSTKSFKIYSENQQLDVLINLYFKDQIMLGIQSCETEYEYLDRKIIS
jgi:hypothetical protein